jgi:hypothetical protein
LPSPDTLTELSAGDDQRTESDGIRKARDLSGGEVSSGEVAVEDGISELRLDRPGDAARSLHSGGVEEPPEGRDERTAPRAGPVDQDGAVSALDHIAEVAVTVDEPCGKRLAIIGRGDRLLQLLEGRPKDSGHVVRHVLQAPLR